MPGAGELRDRYRFERRAEDDNGDRLGAWGADAVTVWTKTQALRGGEGVQAARLEGRQPFLLTVRASTATKLIDNAWRAVDDRDANRVFNIKSAVVTADRAWVEILCEQRVGQTNG